MKKIIARLVLIPYILSTIVSIQPVSAVGTFDVITHSGDTSADGAFSSWAGGGTTVKPGGYIQIASDAQNNTTATGTSVRMNFSNGVADSNYSSGGITASFPSQFYINPTPGYAGGNNGSGFNPPVQNYAIFPQALPPNSVAQAYLYGIKLNQNYTTPTFVPTVSFSGIGLPNSGTSSFIIDVDVKPHIRSVVFSNSSIPNDNSVTTNLTVTVRDWNGCTDLIPGAASVTANLSALGNGYTTVAVPYVSCDAPSNTATFQTGGLMANATATVGPNSITVTAKDNGNYTGGPADTIFWNLGGNIGDTNVGTINVNSSTGPTPAIDSTPSPALLGTSGSSAIGWHSNKLGTYEVRVGGTSCINGTLLSSGSIASTGTNSIISSINTSSLISGVNTIYLCAIDAANNIGLVTTSITKDITPPTSSITTWSPSTITTQNVAVTWHASEAGTYVIEANGSNLTGANGINITGSYTAWDIISTINNSVFNNGSNTIRVRFTDTVGNGPIYSTNSATISKDFTPPLPPQSVTLTDCDALGNTLTPCAIFGNPKNGVTGRDFYINFVLPTATGSIQEYDMYATLSGQVLTSTSSILKRVYQNDLVWLTSTGIWLDDATVTDSNGNPFITSGTGTYYATVKSFKSNGLYSSGTDSSGSIISFDTIVLPTLSGASFTSNTGITLTYSKTLTGALNFFNATKISSASGCFTMDTITGTGAKSVSGSTVTFAVQSLGSIAKTCNDMSIGTGAITDSQGLYNEESLAGQTVSDGQIPTPITITAPGNNHFVGGSGTFTFSYSFPENMNTGSIMARFTSATGSIIDYTLPTFSLSGSHSVILTGSVIGLVDGQTYTLRLLGNDIAGNSGISSLVTGLIYDITPPSLPTLSLPVPGSFIGTSTPTLTWVGSTDNYSSAANLRYTLEISTVVDFSSILQTNSAISGTGFLLSTPLITNTGYYWRVKATDEAGNTGSLSTTSSFTFDNTLPVINILGSDTYINNTARSFTGYIKSGDTAVLHAKITDNFQSSMLASDITANLTSLWGGASVTPTSYITGTSLATWNSIVTTCTDGTKNIPITATDRAGNVGNYTATVVCDNTAPAITAGTFTSPAAAGYLSGGIATNITWNTTFYSTEASPIALPIASVDYSSDGGVNWTNITTNIGNTGTTPWTTPAADSTNFQLRIVAKDKLSNTGTGTITFTVDSTNPSVSAATILTPNGGEFLKGSTGTGINITWNTGIITDTNIATIPISLDYSTDSGSTWTNITTGLANNGSYLWTPPAPTYNSNTIRVRLVATDKVGHASSDTSDANFSIDSTLPTISVTSPNTPPIGSFINNSGFDLQASGTDTNIDKVYYSFSYGANYWVAGSSGYLGTPTWNQLCNTPASCSTINTTIAPTIVDGTVYTLILRSIDKTGNFLDSASSTFTGDTGLPSITNLIQSGSYFSGSVTIAGTGTDIRSGIASLTLQIKRSTDNWYYNGTTFVNTGAISLLTTGSPGYANWSYTGFNIPVGDADGTQYIVTTTAIDRAYKINNTSSGALTLIKDATGPTIAAPVWTNPLWGELWNGGTSKTITWNPVQITDAVSGVNTTSGIIIEYSTGGVWNMVANNVANSGSYNWTLPYPLDASVTLRIMARDTVGNLGAWVVSNSFTIDSIPPIITTVETIGNSLGKVSGVRVSFSENINTAGITTSQFSSSFGAAFAPGYTIVSQQIIELNFTSATGTTALTGTLSYSGNSIHDIAGNLLAGVTKNIADKAAPIITSTVLLDSNGNGKIDQIKVNWSETLTSTTDTTVWTINNPLPGVGINPTGVSVSGNFATLTLSEPTSLNTSSGGMTLSFATNVNWKDTSTSLNQASSLANSILIDQATPIISQIQTFDNAGKYAIDLTFSEPIIGTLSWFTLSGSSTYTGTILQPTVNTLRLITTDSTATNTAKAYSLSYNGSGTYLKDSSNNYLANFSNTGVTDAIAPKLLTRTTVDSNGNGKIDGIRLGFSEPISGSSSGTTISVAGYIVTGYTISGTGLTANLTEALTPDTSATPLVQIQNTTLTDVSGNVIPSEGSTTPATDAVGPVVTSVRFDGTTTLYATFSESISGTLASGSFILSGATATISSINIPIGSNSGTLTLSNSGVIYGTSELSFTPNSAGDTSNNKQSTTFFTKISASVIINEVMFSTGTSDQYIELRNLGSTSVSLSGWTLQNAWGVVTLPSGAIIGTGGFYLIANTWSANSILLNTLIPDFITSSLNLAPTTQSDLVLKDSQNIVFDSAKASPWSAGSGTLNVSMERIASIGDGLQPSSWYSAQTGSGFFDSVGPLGTPGAANVFDATPPNITSSSPANNILFPIGTITLSYNYSDSGGIAPTPIHTFLLEKNNGVWVFNNVTATGITSSGITTSSASFTTNALSFGNYRATFTIQDAAGNVTQKIIYFYVDQIEFIISTGSTNIGVLSTTNTLTTPPITVTIKTVGAGFNLSLGGSGAMSAGVTELAPWNGTKGFGFTSAAGGSWVTNISGTGGLSPINPTILENIAFGTGNYVGGNGVQKTYTYTITYGAQIDSLQAAGVYGANTSYNLGLSY